VDAYIQSLREALSQISHEIRVRESKNGSRVFALVERGNEASFHSLVQGVSVPERLSRRLSGPWPASEFLSEAVRMPDPYK
jgi:predicted nucleic acid-binding Zn ribbon protein